MASDHYAQLETESYTIAGDFDLIVRVIECEDITLSDGIGMNARKVTESKPKKVHQFLVKREILANASAEFTPLFGLGSKFKEGNEDVITVPVDPYDGMLLWFHFLHNVSFDVTAIAATSVSSVWNMLAVAHKYELDPKTPQTMAWFEMWYEKVIAGKVWDTEEAAMLLFPCFVFDHAQGFATLTKHLAYHGTGHITEKRPPGFQVDNLRLNNVIIQQINASKGRLKTILHRKLYAPIAKLLSDSMTCNCKTSTLFAYEKALFDTKAWPLETAYISRSMDDILQSLKRFASPASLLDSCLQCRFNYAQVVSNGSRETAKYFDGLCLDCMNTSKPKHRDADEDYWNHANRRVEWDAKCRIKHGQPTWYFSFMGRREKMVQWTSKRSRGMKHEHY